MKKKGAALLVVVIIMMITFLLAAIMIEVSIKNKTVSSDVQESTKSYYCAEAGIYDAIYYIEEMASKGSLNSSYINYNIPIQNYYSSREKGGTENIYLFGDETAIYNASILITSISKDNNPTPKDKYTCTIYSKGTYNNQNYLINCEVVVFFDKDSNSYKYIFNKKVSCKD